MNKFKEDDLCKWAEHLGYEKVVRVLNKTHGYNGMYDVQVVSKNSDFTYKHIFMTAERNLTLIDNFTDLDWIMWSVNLNEF